MSLIHYSETSFGKLRSEVVKQTARYKPKGLWLSEGDAWEIFAQFKKIKYKTVVKLRKSTRLFRIDLRDLQGLQATLGVSVDGYTVLDWSQIAATGYHGVDYRHVYAQLSKKRKDVQSTIRKAHLWLAMVDIPCVVLWDTNQVSEYHTTKA